MSQTPGLFFERSNAEILNENIVRNPNQLLYWPKGVLRRRASPGSLTRPRRGVL